MEPGDANTVSQPPQCSMQPCVNPRGRGEHHIGVSKQVAYFFLAGFDLSEVGQLDNRGSLTNGQLAGWLPRPRYLMTPASDVLTHNLLPVHRVHSTYSLSKLMHDIAAALLLKHKSTVCSVLSMVW